jgi:hypothetical protein
VLGEALRLNLQMTPVEYAECDMEWYYELLAVKDAYQSGQQMARDTAAEIKRETGT